MFTEYYKLKGWSSMKKTLTERQLSEMAAETIIENGVEAIWSSKPHAGLDVRSIIENSQRMQEAQMENDEQRFYGYLRISEIDAQIVERHGLRVGMITSYTRLLIVRG